MDDGPGAGSDGPLRGGAVFGAGFPVEEAVSGLGGGGDGVVERRGGGGGDWLVGFRMMSSFFSCSLGAFESESCPIAKTREAYL